MGDGRAAACPYGYVSVNKELVVVRGGGSGEDDLSEVSGTGMVLNTVVGWMNENGYKRVVKGEDKVITSDFVSSVLGNPIYYGMIVYNRRTNSEEIKKNPKEIISVRGKHGGNYFGRCLDAGAGEAEEAEKAAEKVDDPERISILSGLVKCPVCGTGMIQKRINERTIIMGLL